MMLGRRRTEALLRIMLCAMFCTAAVACTERRTAGAPSGQLIVLTDATLASGGTDTVRFGRLHQGETALRQLSLRNDGTEPTIVVGHETTCGCVALEYERRPVKPGESLPVRMTFDSRGEYGWQMKLLTLRLGAKALPLKIYVEAEVE
ncbi:MAG: DUF1573 domain-containing protein [Alistipes sp.]|nr:DUF1573 domain-containing protein [Alistipes sp.]